MKIANSPFFSLLIPTKNRPQLLLGVVNSCLAQTFSDFEIIISDNSDTPLSDEIINELIVDHRIKYFRTGNLSMADNWEATILNSSGKFLFPIADKLLLHPEALSIIAGATKSEGVEVYSFKHASLPDLSKKPKGTWKVFATKRLIDASCCGDISLYNEFGLRGYSLIVENSLIQRVKKDFGRTIIPYCPDFTLAFISTLNTDYFSYYNEPLFKYSDSPSNGASTQFRGKLYYQFLADYGVTEEALYSLVPIKVQTVWNIVLNDFFRSCEHVGKEYSLETMDKVRYWESVYGELVLMKSIFHLDFTKEFQRMFQYLEDAGLFCNSEIANVLERNSAVTKSNLLASNANRSFLRQGFRFIKKIFLQLRGKN